MSNVARHQLAFDYGFVYFDFGLENMFNKIIFLNFHKIYFAFGSYGK